MTELHAKAGASRILLVEDEDLIQMVIASQLEDLGFSVEMAGTAAEARNKMSLLEGTLAAAIIDMGLPDARGEDLVKELRAGFPALPIVISSGYGRAALEGIFSDAQPLEFLTKPYTEDQLRAALRRVGVNA